MITSNKVVSDRITRERTFEIVHTRADGKDALAQIAITIHQLIEEGFTGCLEIHYNQGHVSTCKAKESQKV